jgi:hypothetical protein
MLTEAKRAKIETTFFQLDLYKTKPDTAHFKNEIIGYHLKCPLSRVAIADQIVYAGIVLDRKPYAIP